jgi:hypothetical protein
LFFDAPPVFDATRGSEDGRFVSLILNGILAEPVGLSIGSYIPAMQGCRAFRS